MYTEKDLTKLTFADLSEIAQTEFGSTASFKSKKEIIEFILSSVTTDPQNDVEEEAPIEPQDDTVFMAELNRRLASSSSTSFEVELAKRRGQSTQNLSIEDVIRQRQSKFSK